MIDGKFDNEGCALIEEENLDDATVTFPDFDIDDWLSEEEHEKNTAQPKQTQSEG